MNASRLRLVITCLLLLIDLAGCTAPDQPVAWQNSTIDALLDGNYDGEVSFVELNHHGDFGIGTFNELDGEMVAYEGAFWQVQSDGRVSRVSPEMRTPFSVVTFFKPDRFEPLSNVTDFHELQRRLDKMRQSPGRAHAFAVHGAFSRVRVRSVPKQKPPYARLAKVVKKQSIFELKNVRGTVVGFWFPESLRHANVPGYHFHFIAADRSAGGHVLECSLVEGKVASQELRELHIAIPKTPPTTRPAASHDELEKVER